MIHDGEFALLAADKKSGTGTPKSPIVSTARRIVSAGE
jgi:hypothetical protein